MKLGKNLTLAINERVKMRAKAAGLNLSKVAENAIVDALKKLEAPLVSQEKK